MERYLRSAFVLIILLVVQTVFVPFMILRGVVPDVLLIWVVYIALRRGQVEATVVGFIVGLLQDVTATQFLGLAALAKTIAGFAAGYFYNENQTEQTLSSYRFVMIVVVCSLIHNVVYFTIFLQGAGVPLVSTMLQFSFTTALYTSALSFLPMFAFARKYRLT